MSRKRRNRNLIQIANLSVGDKYYVNIVGIDYDEFEIIKIDPVGNMWYRNNSFKPDRTLYCPHDGSLMERLVHKKRPAVQMPLFIETATVQIDLFE